MVRLITGDQDISPSSATSLKGPTPGRRTVWVSGACLLCVPSLCSRWPDGRLGFLQRVLTARVSPMGRKT